MKCFLVIKEIAALAESSLVHVVPEQGLAMIYKAVEVNWIFATGGLTDGQE